MRLSTFSFIKYFSALEIILAIFFCKSTRANFNILYLDPKSIEIRCSTDNNSPTKKKKTDIEILYDGRLIFYSEVKNYFWDRMFFSNQKQKLIYICNENLRKTVKTATLEKKQVLLNYASISWSNLLTFGQSPGQKLFASDNGEPSIYTGDRSKKYQGTIEFENSPNRTNQNTASAK